MAYWLIKSEPSAYSWDQLVKDKKTSWTGVRNFQAQINLKAMKTGDRAFFYHSGEGKEIVGIAEVVKTAYPDSTDKDGKSVTVDFKAVEPVKKKVTLAEIKADPKFKEMKLVRQSRLSVSPVSDEHWKLLLKMASGILAMSAAVVVFIFNDALIKLAAESVPAVQAIGVRGLFATLWCALALLVTGTWRQLRWSAHPRI